MLLSVPLLLFRPLPGLSLGDLAGLLLGGSLPLFLLRCRLCFLLLLLILLQALTLGHKLLALFLEPASLLLLLQLLFLEVLLLFRQELRFLFLLPVLLGNPQLFGLLSALLLLLSKSLLLVPDLHRLDRLGPLRRLPCSRLSTLLLRPGRPRLGLSPEEASESQHRDCRQHQNHATTNEQRRLAAFRGGDVIQSDLVNRLALRHRGSLTRVDDTLLSGSGSGLPGKTHGLSGTDLPRSSFRAFGSLVPGGGDPHSGCHGFESAHLHFVLRGPLPCFQGSDETIVELVDGLGALFRVLGQYLHEEIIQGGRNLHVGIGHVQRPGRLVHLLQQDPHRRRVHKRRGAGQHLVHYDAQRVYVAANVEGLAHRLLGAQIHGSSADHARLGDRLGSAVFEHLGDAEIQHLAELLSTLVGKDEDVVRLEIPVENPLAVGFAQRLAGVPHDQGHPLGGQGRLILDHSGQGPAVEQLHGEVEQPFLSNAEIIEGDDVRAAQAAHRLGLHQETLDRSFVLHQFAPQHFQGYGPVDNGLPRPVDNSHPALSKGPQDLVPVVEDLPCQVLVEGCNQPGLAVRAQRHVGVFLELPETLGAEPLLHRPPSVACAVRRQSRHIGLPSGHPPSQRRL